MKSATWSGCAKKRSGNITLTACITCLSGIGTNLPSLLCSWENTHSVSALSAVLSLLFLRRMEETRRSILREETTRRIAADYEPPKHGRRRVAWD